MAICKESIGTLTLSSTTQVILTGRSTIKFGGLYKFLNSPSLSTTVSGIGGLDTGSIAASTLYYVYAVSNGSTTGIIASTNNQQPTGFTRYKKVGAFYTNSSSLIDSAFFFEQTLSNEAQFYGGVESIATAGCSWGSPNTTYASVSAVAACPIPITSGLASAPLTKIPAIRFATLDAGEYLVLVQGKFQLSTTTVFAQSFVRLSDGINNYGDNFAAISNVGGVNNISMSQTHTFRVNRSVASSNVELAVQMKTTTSSNAWNLAASENSFSIMVYKIGALRVIDWKDY